MELSIIFFGDDGAGGGGVGVGSVGVVGGRKPSSTCTSTSLESTPVLIASRGLIFGELFDDFGDGDEEHGTIAEPGFSGLLSLETVFRSLEKESILAQSLM